jgi:hypothetical protein
MRSVLTKGSVAVRLRKALEAGSTADGMRPRECVPWVADCYPGMPSSAAGMRVGQLLARWVKMGKAERTTTAGGTFYRLPVDTRKLEA